MSSQLHLHQPSREYIFSFEYLIRHTLGYQKEEQQRYTCVFFLGSEATATQTSQHRVEPTADSPLPTEYWTRPILRRRLQLGTQRFTLARQRRLQLRHKRQPSWIIPTRRHDLMQQRTGPDLTPPFGQLHFEDGGVVGGINTGITGATFYQRFIRRQIPECAYHQRQTYYQAPLRRPSKHTAPAEAHTYQILKNSEIL